jgi:hypothetical protein
MKTLKLSMVAMLVAFTLASLSSSAQVMKEKPNFKKVVVMSYEQAVKDPALVRAMQLQLDKHDFLDSHQNFYVAEVLYRGSTYHIDGTYEQWQRFFWYDWTTRSKKAIPGSRTAE